MPSHVACGIRTASDVSRDRLPVARKLHINAIFEAESHPLRSLNSFAKQNNQNVHKIAPRPVELFYTRINELRDSRRSKAPSLGATLLCLHFMIEEPSEKFRPRRNFS